MANFFLNRIIGKLINKEVEQHQLSQSSQSRVEKKIFPCITVSREAGSGGRLIAALVAKKLKTKFYDKEFVELIAKNAHKRKSVVMALDETLRNMIEEIIESLHSPKDKMSGITYFKYLCRTILSLAQKNKAVFLGRGSNFIIPSQRNLRVRIIAPLAVRIKYTVMYEKKSLAQAKETIRRLHFGRKDFVRKYFCKDGSNANYYDLVINTEYFTIDQAVQLVIQAFHQKFPTAA